MKKEQVKKFDLEAAFKALDEIEIPVAEKGIKANRVNFKETLSQKSAYDVLVEDYFNIGDNEALEEAQEEREGEVAQAKLDRIEKIVDLDADSPEDLLPSYAGKIIIQCPQCLTLFYKNPEDIDHSEENPDVVNINEICQHCGNSSGYTVIGKVEAVDNNAPADNFELPAEENELDLDFDTEAAEGEEVPEENPDETAPEDLDLDLNLEDLPDEEESANESLNLSKAAPSDFETEHKSENLTLNEGVVTIDANNTKPEDLYYKIDGKEFARKELNGAKSVKLGDADRNPENAEKLKAILNAHGIEVVNESLNNSEELKDAEEGSELKTENESENLTLNEGVRDLFQYIDDYYAKNGRKPIKVTQAELDELAAKYGVEKPYDPALLNRFEITESLTEEVDKDLDKKLAEHNDYIEYLKNNINAKEEALKNEKNEEIKVAIQNELVALQNSLEAALPDALKAEAVADNAEGIEPPVELEEPADEAPVAGVDVEETPADETSAEEPKDEEPAVDEQLTEEIPATEEPAANTINYVDYKHSYCHVLQPMLKKINYLCNVLGDDKADLEKCKNIILKYLKDAKELKYTRKEQEFFDNVKKQESKAALYNYIKNAINKAKEIEVKVDENGELIEGLNEGFETVDESLNLSKEAPSEFETENKSENLTLNEGYVVMYGEKEAEHKEFDSEEEANKFAAENNGRVVPMRNESLNEDVNAEIDSIIASWGDVNEELKEEASDAFLDSPEFKEPVSDKEVDAIIQDEKAKEESLEECNKQQLTEDPDTDAIEAIMATWDDSPSAVASKPAQEQPADDSKVASEEIDNLGEGCENGECEKPLEECGEKPLKEEAEEPEAEEEAPVEEEPVEGEPEVEEEAEEEEPTPIETTVEEVKDVALDAAKAALAEEEAAEVILPEEEVKEITDEVVEQKLEVPADEEAEEEAAEEEAPVEEPEFSEDDIDDLDECSLNKHIDEYLKEVYSNVKCFEATGCELKEGKLIVEGKISFNSGKEKLTMFEFLPQYGEGKLFFEGYNKDFSEDKAFTLNCSINESKTLITESFGYKYKINENLVEGLK